MICKELLPLWFLFFILNLSAIVLFVLAHLLHVDSSSLTHWLASRNGNSVKWKPLVSGNSFGDASRAVWKWRKMIRFTDNISPKNDGNIPYLPDETLLFEIIEWPIKNILIFHCFRWWFFFELFNTLDNNNSIVNSRGVWNVIHNDLFEKKID